MEDAIDAGKFQLMNTLLVKTTDDKVVRKKNKHNQSLFHALARYNGYMGVWASVLSNLLFCRGVDFKSKDDMGTYPIHYAARNNQTTLIEFFLNHGVDKDVLDGDGNSPLVNLLKAENHPSLDTLNTLLSRGSDPNSVYPSVEYKEGGSMPLLIHAVRAKWTDVVNTLFHYDTVNLNIRDNLGRTALLHVLLETNPDKNLLSTLISHLADPNIPDNEGLTPLMQVVKENRIDLYGHLITSQTKLDYNAQDNKGWTVIHHVVSPLEFGSYENVEFLKLLVENGADINITDKEKLPPLHYALLQEDHKMADYLISLGAKQIPIPPVRRSSVLESKLWPDPLIDVNADFKTFVRGLSKDIEEPQPPQVDPSLQMQHAEVLNDVGLLYDIFIVKTEVNNGRFGSNNFYIMQVVHDKVKDIYILFNRWGRIGDEGNFQRTPYHSKEEVTLEFAKIFKSKTGNIWEKNLKFEKKPKKWRLLEINRVKKDYSKLQLKPWVSSQCAESVLLPSLQKVISKITDINMLQKTVYNSGINTDLLPLTKFSRNILDDALKILGDIDTRLKFIENEQQKLVNDMDLTKIQEYYDEISDLSNSFYEIIPHRNFAYTRMPPLNERNMVNGKLDMLNNLSDVCLARKLVMAASLYASDVHPYDYCYASFLIKLEPLEKTNGEYKAIQKYFENTSSGCHKHLKRIFRLQRKGEGEQMRQWKHLDNHYLLWHGSGIANFIGILSEGLRIAPLSSPVSGYAFGKGVYFADMAGKSFQYCRAVYGESSLLLLAEVALGNMYEVYNSNYFEVPPTGFHSVHALGNHGPDFSEAIVLSNGVRIPNKPTKHYQNNSNDPNKYRYLPHNEYIVYNTSQVRLRYLVELT